MRTDDFRPSDNVEDDREASASRGGMPGGAGGLGIGTIIIIGLISWYFGIDPSVLLNGAQILSGGGTTQQSDQAPPTQAGTPQDATGRFVALVLGDTEDRWTEIFAANNKTYHDTSFFNDMQTKFGACSNSKACQFSEAYVIAHEVGHHVQDELGILPRVTQMQQEASSKAQSNALQVRIELQADCFAGVWANRAQAKHNFLDPGDVDQALQTASAIGDDRLQKETQGYVVPDSFTHGTSDQRKRWFQNGFNGGKVSGCDTIAANSL